jgi:Na+/H+ antiporter NhaD/arsenite permease-like protein
MGGGAVQFAIFGATLAGVALLHRRTLTVALVGLSAIVLWRLVGAGLAPGAAALGERFAHEWVTLANLFLLLMGFAVLSNQFERSNAPEVMPRLLPDDWTGGLALLAMVSVLSVFLDNIAGAVIGAIVARHVYRGRVSIGYLAAIVAASNAGGAGSVVGDTTTTMMWLSGVPPLHVADAFVGSATALAIFGVVAARAQHRFQPIVPHAPAAVQVDWMRLVTVGVMLAAILAVNVVGTAVFPAVEDALPVTGLALWIAIGATALVRRPDWTVLGGAFKGAVFLCALVAAAALMPVERLPPPSWPTTLGLGFLSAVFDNIPLTALALNQGGYDWGLLAYAVGFGGSMVWFGSSAGVAVASLFPEARSVVGWVRQGWAIPLAYVAGFAAILALFGWAPG